eukprot:gene8550-13209_t
MATPFGEMVVGIDLGTQNTRCALMAKHQRMPDIVRNNFSLESTPSIVAFDEVRRHVGEEGALKISSRPKWAANFLRLLFSERSTADLDMTYTIEDGVFKTPRGDFNLPQLLSMLFQVVLGYSRKAVGAAEDELPAKVVVSVPQCFPAAKEQIVAALGILGFPKEKVLVCTDGTAAVLCYRGRRFETLAKTLDEAKPVAIVDVGHGYQTVCVFKAAREGVEVLSESSSPIGSATIDEAILSSIVKELQEKHNEPLKTKVKQYARMRKEAMKGKEIMSTLPQYAIHAEALTDTLDLKYDVTKDAIVAGAEPLVKALKENVAKTLAAASVTPDSLVEVETIGGGWRTPCVLDALKAAFATDTLCTHLDPVQSVAHGCALAGVMKKPTAPAAAAAPEEAAAPQQEQEKEAAEQAEKPAEPATGDVEMKGPEADGAPAPAPAGSPVSEEPEDTTNGVHFFDFGFSVESGVEPLAGKRNTLGNNLYTDDEVKRMREVEIAMKKDEDEYHRRMNARNEFESYFLQLPQIGFDAKLTDEVMDKLNAKVKEFDEWLLGPEGEEATVEMFKEKLAAAKEDVAANFAQLNEHLEKKRLEEEARETERQQAMREARETREPKTDPQRVKAAQERKDQGVVLFKNEDYAQATTRFVQALTHLK